MSKCVVCWERGVVVEDLCQDCDESRGSNVWGSERRWAANRARHYAVSRSAADIDIAKKERNETLRSIRAGISAHERERYRLMSVVAACKAHLNPSQKQMSLDLPFDVDAEAENFYDMRDMETTLKVAIQREIGDGYRDIVRDIIRDMKSINDKRRKKS